jgi:hypothetical protein
MIIQRIALEEPIYLLEGEEMSVRIIDPTHCEVTIKKGDARASAVIGCTLSQIKHGEWETIR